MHIKSIFAIFANGQAQYKHKIPIVWTLKHYFGIFLILTLLYTEIKYCFLP